MLLYPDRWLELPDGRRYQGETLENSCTPHGLGIITLGDDHHFYVGEFAHGKRHGRGFTLTHKQWKAVEPVWVKGTYEEIMATARFDSCGRVIHCDNVGHYENQTVHHEQWIKECDGLWDDDNFNQPSDPDALKRAPWKWAMTQYDCNQYGNPETDFRNAFTNHIADAKPDGGYSFNGSAYVTVFDENHLLFCDCRGHVFTLGIDQSHSYTVGDECHNFHLSLDEPRYNQLFESAKFDELIHDVFTFSPIMSQKAAKYFMRIFYLRSTAFMVSDESIALIKQAADAGNRYAQFAYGRYHILKEVDENSGTISLKYFQMAQEQGLYDATAAISQACDNGDMGMVDRSKAQQLLLEALEHESDFAAVIRLKHLLFGHHGSHPQPQLALEIARSLRDRDAKLGTPSGIWIFYYAIALSDLDKKDDARHYFAHAARMGVVDAWYDLALSECKFDDNGNLINAETFKKALNEGINHHSSDCLTMLASIRYDEFPNLSDVERTDECAAEIISMFEKSYSWGDACAALMLGNIFYYGDVTQEENNKTAFSWYAKAALWDNTEAYEKMYGMVRDHYIDADQSFSDHLALNGTRLGSKKLLAETVMAYTYGRLTEFAAEIEQYYCPIFDSDDFTIDDPYNDDDNDTPEPPDDDGRFDAWA
ncbi:MAG: hypothetical protein ACI4UN_09700 [Muribaculaceae bacterium]